VGILATIFQRRGWVGDSVHWPPRGRGGLV